MTFEFDSEKSALNKTKHGIDFEEAQELWLGKIVGVTLEFSGEPRKLLIGQIRGKFWAAITTTRGTATRIISVRRARRKEIAIYEQTF